MRCRVRCLADIALRCNDAAQRVSYFAPCKIVMPNSCVIRMQMMSALRDVILGFEQDNAVKVAVIRYFPSIDTLCLARCRDLATYRGTLCDTLPDFMLR